MIELIEIEEIVSTNSLMSDRLDGLGHGSVILAWRQTGGRGQRGNSWESEPGRNVTMSLLLRDLPVGPRDQFAVSEAVALAVADTLASYAPDLNLAVKWPNDVYVGDLKIAGILIECGIEGSDLTHAIAGIGVDINQRVFVSDAPNPVSLAQLTGRDDYDLKAIARQIAERTVESLSPDRFDRDELHRRYLRRLWRREGMHLWRRSADGQVISASIAGVSPEGFLSLLPEGAREPLPPFAFKEVTAMLTDQNGYPIAR